MEREMVVKICNEKKSKGELTGYLVRMLNNKKKLKKLYRSSPSPLAPPT